MQFVGPNVAQTSCITISRSERFAKLSDGLFASRLTPQLFGRILLPQAGEPTRSEVFLGQMAESSAVVCGRPVEPAPDNAGEGMASFLVFLGCSNLN
jgi:hypothetical protein